MIRYVFSREELEERVEEEAAGWLAEASAKTALLITAGRFDEPEGRHTWGKVKKVLLRFQHNKCIFCERLLPGSAHGSVEQDLEHFRAKGRIRTWRPQERGEAESPEGYYWLAYELGNFAVACKTCNSGLKRDFFPIEGQRVTVPTSIVELNRIERPLLLFPMGDNGDDAEQWIIFLGTIPQPRPVADGEGGYPHRQASVTIEFFRLADPLREELVRERSAAIDRLWSKIRLWQTARDPEEAERVRLQIEHMLADCGEPHASCVRSFYRTFEKDPMEAYSIYRMVARYLESLGKHERIGSR